MKKFILLAALMVASPAFADEAATQQVIQTNELVIRLQKSILHIINEQSDGNISSGSCGVIAVDQKAITVVTAGHVVDGASRIYILHENKKYAMQEVHSVPGTDAAWCVFELVPGAKALELNLDPSGARTPALSFGYWGRAGSDATLTGSFGILNRTAIDKFSGDDYKVWAALLPGTQLVYFGYSGGVVVDEKLRIMGVNAVLTQVESLAVDIRYIWNKMPGHEKTQIVIPYDYNYNLIGSAVNGLQRLSVQDTDKLVRTDGSVITITELYRLIEAELARRSPIVANTLTDIITTSKYHIGGKVYKVIGGKVGIRNKRMGSGPFMRDAKYILLIGDGYELTLLLNE